MTLEQLKNRKEEDRNSTYIPTRWNKEEIKYLYELQGLLGEERTSTVIKRGVIIAVNVLQHTFGRQFEVRLSKRKQKSNKGVCI